MSVFTCEICGNEFESTAHHAKFCPDCRGKAQTLRNQKYKSNRRAGLSVEIGNEQTCPICGKPYIVVTGSQNCCEDCRKQRDRSRKTATNADYQKANYERIRITVPIGQRDEIKAYAESQGMSVNRLFLTALEEYRKQHT